MNLERINYTIPKMKVKIKDSNKWLEIDEIIRYSYPNNIFSAPGKTPKSGPAGIVCVALGVGLHLVSFALFLISINTTSAFQK